MDWEKVVREYGNMIRQCCLQYESDPWSLEQLVQDVWARAMLKHATFNGDAELGTWLWKLAENVGKNHIRSQMARPAIVYESQLGGIMMGDDDMEITLEDVTADFCTPEQWILAEEWADEIERRVQGLSAQQRKIYDLVYRDHLDSGEASALLGTSAIAVRVQLHRIREILGF